MERGRKRVRMCLLCVVLLAIVVGLFYYYYELQNQQKMTEGTLVSNVIEGAQQLCP